MTDAPRTSRLAIRHVTSYRWSEPVTYALQQLRLIPKSRPGQQVVDWVTDIDGGQIEVSFDDAVDREMGVASAEGLAWTGLAMDPEKPNQGRLFYLKRITESA